MKERGDALYLILCTLFCSVLLVSNVIAAKLFRFPGFGSTLPVGLITYPLTFLLSDVISEVFGPYRAKLTIYLGFAMSLIMVAIVQLALGLPPDPSWPHQEAFETVFGANLYAVGGSLAGYVLAQSTDIFLFERLRQWSRGRHLWLRNNLSTLLSQLLDTCLVSYIFLGWGLGLTWEQLLPLMVAAYGYKALFAILDTPFCYLAVYGARAYLNHGPVPARDPA